MKFTQKNLIIFIILGMVASGIPAITLCSSHCVVSNASLDIPPDGPCSFSAHAFVQMGIEESSFAVTPLLGFFQITSAVFIPPGHFLSIFKPPRSRL
jgi:hypothetical protein